MYFFFLLSFTYLFLDFSLIQITFDLPRLYSIQFLYQCPVTWQNEWEGPEEPLQYLRAVVTRAGAIQVNCCQTNNYPMLDCHSNRPIPLSHNQVNT